MEIKICVFCNSEKVMLIFSTNIKNVNSVKKRSLKRYNENKDKLSNQLKKHCKKIEMCYLQIPN